MLRYRDIDSQTLLCTHCPCGHLTIHGFLHQLPEPTINRRLLRATWMLACQRCGSEHRCVKRLTTGRVRSRWINWTRTFMWLLHTRLAWRFKDWLIPLTFWLERRVKL